MRDKDLNEKYTELRKKISREFDNPIVEVKWRETILGVGKIKEESAKSKVTVSCTESLR